MVDSTENNLQHVFAVQVAFLASCAAPGDGIDQIANPHGPLQPSGRPGVLSASAATRLVANLEESDPDMPTAAPRGDRVPRARFDDDPCRGGHAVGDHDDVERLQPHAFFFEFSEVGFQDGG